MNNALSVDATALKQQLKHSLSLANSTCVCTSLRRALLLSRWIRYSRWRPTSRAEAVSAEKKLLALCRCLHLTASTAGYTTRPCIDTLGHAATRSRSETSLWGPPRITSCTQSQEALRVAPRWSACQATVQVRTAYTRTDCCHLQSAGRPEVGPRASQYQCFRVCCAGAGFLFRNLDAMASHFRVHSVDLLGNGMSGGPPALGTPAEAISAGLLLHSTRVIRTLRAGSCCCAGVLLCVTLACSCLQPAACPGTHWSRLPPSCAAAPNVPDPCPAAKHPHSWLQ